MKKRPLALILLIFVVVVLTGYYATRFVAAITQWSFLVSWVSYGVAAYYGISGVVFALTFIPLGVGLWRGDGWAYRAAGYVFPVYAGWFAIERVVIIPKFSWNYAILLDLITACVFCAWVMWVLKRKDIKGYFNDEREQIGNGTRS